MAQPQFDPRPVGRLGVAFAAGDAGNAKAGYGLGKIGVPVKGTAFGEQKSGRTERHPGDRDEVDSRRLGGPMNLEWRKPVVGRGRAGDGGREGGFAEIDIAPLERKIWIEPVASEGFPPRVRVVDR